VKRANADSPSNLGENVTMAWHQGPAVFWRSLAVGFPNTTTPSCDSRQVTRPLTEHGRHVCSPVWHLLLYTPDIIAASPNSSSARMTTNLYLSPPLTSGASDSSLARPSPRPSSRIHPAPLFCKPKPSTPQFPLPRPSSQQTRWRIRSRASSVMTSGKWKRTATLASADQEQLPFVEFSVE